MRETQTSRPGFAGDVAERGTAVCHTRRHVDGRANTTQEFVQLQANTHARTFLYVVIFGRFLSPFFRIIGNRGQIAAPPDGNL